VCGGRLSLIFIRWRSGVCSGGRKLKERGSWGKVVFRKGMNAKRGRSRWRSGVHGWDER